MMNENSNSTEFNNFKFLVSPSIVDNYEGRMSKTFYFRNLKDEPILLKFESTGALCTKEQLKTNQKELDILSFKSLISIKEDSSFPLYKINLTFGVGSEVLGNCNKCKFFRQFTSSPFIVVIDDKNIINCEVIDECKIKSFTAFFDKGIIPFFSAIFRCTLRSHIADKESPIGQHFDISVNTSSVIERLYFQSIPIHRRVNYRKSCKNESDEKEQNSEIEEIEDKNLGFELYKINPVDLELEEMRINSALNHVITEESKNNETVKEINFPIPKTKDDLSVSICPDCGDVKGGHFVIISRASERFDQNSLVYWDEQMISRDRIAFNDSKTQIVFQTLPKKQKKTVSVIITGGPFIFSTKYCYIGKTSLKTRRSVMEKELNIEQDQEEQPSPSKKQKIYQLD